jgi:hypothetical protein
MWSINANDYDSLEWMSESAKPTKKELDDLWEMVQVEMKTEKEVKVTQRQAILDRLGLTAEEAALLLS